MLRGQREKLVEEARKALEAGAAADLEAKAAAREVC